MNDNKSRDIFYGVVAVATLIVALIGATLAYFSITATSGEGAVNARSAVVSINYEDGKNVIAQAEKLIPVNFDDVLKPIYENNLNLTGLASDWSARNASAPSGDEPTERERRCKDGRNPNYDVCSVYRFSVSNDTQTTIKAMLRSENNEFRDLAYAVYVVQGSSDTSSPYHTGNWLNVGYNDSNQPLQYAKLKFCDDNAGSQCYTETGGVKNYENNAINSIFGYTIDAQENTEFNTVNIANTEYIFDVVLFILESGGKQDYDQGKSYQGNIYVETTAGDQQITGHVS